MIVKYRTRFNSIKKVEFEKETEKTLFFLGGRRTAKHSAWDNYFDTWEEAKKVLIQCQIDKVDKLEYHLQNAKESLVKIRDMPDYFEGKDEQISKK